MQKGKSNKQKRKEKTTSKRNNKQKRVKVSMMEKVASIKTKEQKVDFLQEMNAIEEDLEKKRVLDLVTKEMMEVSDRCLRELVQCKSERASRSLKRRLGNEELVDKKWKKEYEEKNEWERLNELMGIVPFLKTASP